MLTGIRYPRFVSSLSFAVLVLLMGVACAQSGETEPRFFRGLNLNGPSLVIDGNPWEGSESAWYRSEDHAFDNQKVPLFPPTDSERSKMIRSSRYGGNRIELRDIPPGSYSVFLYVWEDNNAESFSVGLNGRTVLERYNSGQAGRWSKLGPWKFECTATSNLIVTSSGGTANFSGIEIWHGEYDGLGLALSEDAVAFFEKRIRPLLIAKCYECHSAEASEVQGELLVDSRATLQRGGATGPAVIAGDVDHSLLIEAVRYENDSMQMPPDGKLSDVEIADLEAWVRMGAPDPRSTATKHEGKQIDIESARHFWSLRPITDPSLPQVQHPQWPRNTIDTWVLAELEAHDLTPSPDADKRSLIRRATFDLIGLPPTVKEVNDFLSDDSVDAFERVIDRLLESPRYGERWGRHWLDIVRYADTAGDNSDFPIPQIHRYRDWVIDAFNRDLPYDEFVRDQLSGDLRGGANESQRIERLIATGYIANARRFGSRVDDYPQHLTIEDTIDNVGRAFLGLTLSCARCHDHKFDPITNRDYYALYGIFHSTRYPWPGIELDQKQRDFVPLVTPDQWPSVEKSLDQRAQEQSRLEEEVKRWKEELKKATDANKSELEQKLKAAEGQAKEQRELPPLFDTAYAVADSKVLEDVAVQLKGDPTRLGDRVPRRFLTVLGGQSLPSDLQSSGRVQLADWILDPNNPLTARVMANRIWQHHFGRGIVATPNDFGKQGKPPTHGDLLDHLASRFRESGWSIKSMHRWIMLSRTYQQSSDRESAAIALDPTNQWFSGFPRRRLDAESIRDALLMHGGNLDLSPAGPHPFPPTHSFGFTQHNPFKAIYPTNRRSVYLMTQRIQRDPYLSIFDGADPSTSTAARMVSTTPLQALYLLNDPFVHEQSERVAEALFQAAEEDSARIAIAYQRLFSRPPTSEETTSGLDFLKKAQQLVQTTEDSQKDGVKEPWLAYVRVLFRLNEFVYLD